jgi:two-component system sensor histidine kinase YesM
MQIEFDFALFAAGMVFFIFLSVIVCQYLLYRPFFRINQALYEIAGGDLTLRLDNNSRLKEISTLERAINHLLDEINDLKISVYETKLQQRNVTCHYLKIRLKTHFYLNCLSIIHAMARVKNTELIKELTTSLSEYLRFIDKDAEELVKLEDELSHTRGYARIQELRFPGVFQYIEDIPAGLYSVRIPPLILQTFIENSVEHAMRHDHKNWVRLQAVYEVRKEIPGIRFLITDSGKGFNDNMLNALSERPVKLEPGQTESIGITNVISRLELIYDGKAEIALSNAESGGSLIDMWLPSV